MIGCVAHHDGHNCRTPGACTRALIAMLDRMDARRDDEARRRAEELAERQNVRTVRLLWPDDPNWSTPR
jgi:hypothetical protein